MKFHDFHLSGYRVEDSGSRIVLDLEYDYPGHERQESRIGFVDVACYSFQHTCGAIITDIEESDPAALVAREAARLRELAHKHGLRFWNTDIPDYIATLQKEGFRGWRIESAIGFSGFVIARSVETVA